jgi:hypothetical protein
MGRLETHGHNGWWPMLAHRRKHMDGTMTGRECFVDMRNGTICEPKDGWNTKDLPYATGRKFAPTPIRRFPGPFEQSNGTGQIELPRSDRD